MSISTSVTLGAVIAGLPSGVSSTGASTRRRRGRPPKPVAIAVTRMWSPIESSMTAPKMTFAFGSADGGHDLRRLVRLGEPELRARP